MNLSEDDSAGQRFVAAFRQTLKELGWLDGRNVGIDVRWGAGNRDRYRQLAAELVSSAPEVIVAATTDPVVSFKGHQLRCRSCSSSSSIQWGPA